MTRSVALLLAVAMLTNPAIAASSNVDAHKGHAVRADASCDLPMGEGLINMIDVKASKLNLTHKPIASLGWDEMTMDFSVEKIVDLSAFYEGERVHFMLSPSSKTYVVAMICSLELSEDAQQACMERMGLEQARIASSLDPQCVDDTVSHHDHH